MDIYELEELSLEQSPMHPRLSLRGGDKYPYVVPHIAIDGYILWGGEEFKLDDYERSLLYVTITERTKKGWEKAYRQARIIKSCVEAKAFAHMKVIAMKRSRFGMVAKSLGHMEGLQ